MMWQCHARQLHVMLWYIIPHRYEPKVPLTGLLKLSVWCVLLVRVRLGSLQMGLPKCIVHNATHVCGQPVGFRCPTSKATLLSNTSWQHNAAHLRSNTCKPGGRAKAHSLGIEPTTPQRVPSRPAVARSADGFMMS
jgi:hypothetical protein